MGFRSGRDMLFDKIWGSSDNLIYIKIIRIFPRFIGSPYDPDPIGISGFQGIRSLTF